MTAFGALRIGGFFIFRPYCYGLQSAAIACGVCMWPIWPRMPMLRILM
uniref:Translocation protein Sec62 n=1 Tax=Siphoviridae sp. ctEIp38 TaxID=2825394 RepID=A0A8S5QDA2_9CAUD|nr:MAG TPA: Translocation protein Sec62 [Siphoviridae sp. ctEIp38]